MRKIISSVFLNLKKLIESIAWLWTPVPKSKITAQTLYNGSKEIKTYEDFLSLKPSLQEGWSWCNKKKHFLKEEA